MMLDPYDMELKDWADNVASAMDRFTPVERLDDESLWQEWGANLLTDLAEDGPNPYGFEDWREWGARLFLTVELW